MYLIVYLLSANCPNISAHLDWINLIMSKRQIYCDKVPYLPNILIFRSLWGLSEDIPSSLNLKRAICLLHFTIVIPKCYYCSQLAFQIEGYKSTAGYICYINVYCCLEITSNCHVHQLHYWLYWQAEPPLFLQLRKTTKTNLKSLSDISDVYIQIYITYIWCIFSSNTVSNMQSCVNISSWIWDIWCV